MNFIHLFNSLRIRSINVLCEWYGNETGNIKTKYTSHFISFNFCCYILCTCQMYWRPQPWFVHASIRFGWFDRQKKPLTCFTNYKIGNPCHSFLANVWHLHLTNKTTWQLFISLCRSLFASRYHHLNIMKWCFTCNLYLFARKYKKKRNIL